VGPQLTQEKLLLGKRKAKVEGPSGKTNANRRGGTDLVIDFYFWSEGRWEKGKSS